MCAESLSNEDAPVDSVQIVQARRGQRDGMGALDGMMSFHLN